MTQDRVQILIVGNSWKAVDGTQYQFKKKKSLQQEAEDSSDTNPSQHTLQVHLASEMTPLLWPTSH